MSLLQQVLSVGFGESSSTECGGATTVSAPFPTDFRFMACGDQGLIVVDVSDISENPSTVRVGTNNAYGVAIIDAHVPRNADVYYYLWGCTGCSDRPEAITLDFTGSAYAASLPWRELAASE